MFVRRVRSELDPRAAYDDPVTVGGVTKVAAVTDKSLVGEPWFVESGHMFPAHLDAGTAEAVGEVAGAAVAAGFTEGRRVHVSRAYLLAVARGEG
jgi:hypothetical protein